MLSWSAYEYVLEWKYGIEYKHMHWIGILPWIEYEHVLEWGHYRGLTMSMYWSGDITVD